MVSGRKRLNQKHEIALLREEAPRLQEQLDHLIAYWKHKSLELMAQNRSQSSSHDGRDSDGAAVGCAEPQWKTIATRQRDELTVAETQNERLNAQVQLHKRALQCIRKLLAKRVVSATVSRCIQSMLLVGAWVLLHRSISYRPCSDSSTPSSS